MFSIHIFLVFPLLVEIVNRPIHIYIALLDVTLKISFDILGLQEISDTPLDLEEDRQLNYSLKVQTSRDAGGKKTTSTPRDTVTDVDRSVSPHRRPAPGGLLGSPH